MLRESGSITPEPGALLARAMFPDPERIRRTLKSYRNDPDRRVFAWVLDVQPLSAAGLRGHGEAAEVLHPGTAPDQEGRGHARALLHAVATHINAARLIAETDDAAVGFCRRAGFEVVSAAPRGDRPPLSLHPHPALSFLRSCTASTSTRSFSSWPSWPLTHTKVRAWMRA
jgi:GNAT superfamily N-acetyltransferase